VTYWGIVAQRPSESEDARFFRDLRGAWVPCLQNPSGLTLYDLSGWNNHGTLTSMDAPTDWVLTSRGVNLDLDGANDFITAVGPLTTLPITLLVWFFPRSTANGAIINLSCDSGFDRWNGISAQSNQVTGYTTDSTTPATISISFAINQWACAAYSIDANGNRIMYVNGVVATGTYTPSTTTVYSAVDIGGFRVRRGATPSSFLNCIVADARVYGRAMSVGEMNALWRGGPGYGLRAKRRFARFGSTSTANRRRRVICGANC
jgi:hypothetical protein